MRRSLAFLIAPAIMIAGGAVIRAFSDSEVGTWLALAGMFLFVAIAFAKTFGLSTLFSDSGDDPDL